MDFLFDILKSVAAGVISNFITPYVRKWLTSQEAEVTSTKNRAQ